MEIIQKLADHLRVAKDKISIISGLSSTKKLIEVSNWMYIINN
jgi:uncharacterized protein YggU (UPF0235/DUF167 family)